MSPEHLFDLMDQVAVRRTRKLRQDPLPAAMRSDLPNGQKVVIVFPTPQWTRLDYDLDPAGRLLNAVVYALDLPDDAPLVSRYVDRRDDPGRLMLARYTPSAYGIDEDDGLEGYQVANAGLLRSALLKRLESSPRALANTLGVLIGSNQAFLDALGPASSSPVRRCGSGPGPTPRTSRTGSPTWTSPRASRSIRSRTTTPTPSPTTSQADLELLDPAEDPRRGGLRRHGAEGRSDGGGTDPHRRRRPPRLPGRHPGR